MSRVERRERDDQWEATERRKRQPVDRTPSKAEGDEETVEQALRKDEAADSLAD
jgi:hypothetical protein